MVCPMMMMIVMKMIIRGLAHEYVAGFVVSDVVIVVVLRAHILFAPSIIAADNAIVLHSADDKYVLIVGGGGHRSHAVLNGLCVAGS